MSSAFCPDGVTEIPAGYVQGPSATKYYRVELYDLVRDFLMAQAACAAEKAKVVEFETPTDWEDFIGEHNPNPILVLMLVTEPT